MATRIETHEAQEHFSEYLDRTASRGERILVERCGRPLAALVSVEDLIRLESLEQSAANRDAHTVQTAAETPLAQAMKAAGIVVQPPVGESVPLNERKILRVAGPPISDQIIADRR